MKIKGRKQSKNIEDRRNIHSSKQNRTIRSPSGPRIGSKADIYGSEMMTAGRRNISKQAWVNKKKNRTQ